MGLPLAALTGKGMTMMYDLGDFCRRRYVDSGFLPEIFRIDDVYVRSAFSDRCIQSASAFGQGLYPPGTSNPIGYSASLPNPIPVFSEDVGTDPLLEVRKGYCRDRLHEDQNLFYANQAPEIFARHSSLMNKLGHACGINFTAYGEERGISQLTFAIKDIADSFTFDKTEGFALIDGVHNEDYKELVKFSYELVYGQLLSQSYSATYIAGTLPQTILANFHDAMASNRANMKMWAYHGHREMLYSVAMYLGMPLDLTEDGLPLGALDSASTLFFELHQHDKTKEFTVRSFLWSPCLNGNRINKKEDIPCDYKPVKLADCDMDCPIDQFEKIVAAPVKKYGTWDQICQYKEPRQLKMELSRSSVEQQELHSRLQTFKIATIIGSVLLALVTYAWLTTRRKAQQFRYESIDRDTFDI